MTANGEWAVVALVVDLPALIRHENAISPLLNGRTVFDDRNNVFRIRARVVCSNLTTTFNFGVSFATLFGTPTKICPDI